MGINLALTLRGTPVAAALLLFLQPGPSFAATCIGADPAVVSVRVEGMQSDGGLNHYTLIGKVVNLGRSGQASNTLQFVEIYKGETKLDSRGVPPLKPGQSYVFQYVTDRSAQAGRRTTALTFRMDVRQPSESPSCDTSNGIAVVRF